MKHGQNQIMILLLKIIQKTIGQIVFYQVYKIHLFINIHFIIIEDSRGNINPYAVTGYTMSHKNKCDNRSIWRDTEQNHCQLDTAGMTFFLF